MTKKLQEYQVGETVTLLVDIPQVMQAPGDFIAVFGEECIVLDVDLDNDLLVVETMDKRVSFSVELSEIAEKQTQ